MMWAAEWLEMVTLVALEKEGLRIEAWLRASSWSFTLSTLLSKKASCCDFSSVGDSLSSGVGANEDVAFESELSPGTRSLFCWASSAASEMEIAEAFLRKDLNWNFFGGLKVLRMFCSFSERALIACMYQLACEAEQQVGA